MPTISVSEMDTFNKCKQKWYWSYEKQITARVMQRAPSLGAAGHVALNAMYKGQDFGEALEEWRDKEIESRSFFDQELTEFNEIIKTVTKIILRYEAFYRGDNFKTIASEDSFTVPLYNEWNLAGYMDQIVEDTEGNLWLMESKFVKSFRKEDDLSFDLQTGLYQWACRQLGYNIVGTIYNQISSQNPTEPKINKDGSLSKVKINCGWETYRDIVLMLGQDPNDYLDMKEKLSDVKFFKRYYIMRTPAEMNFFAEDAIRRLKEMKREDKNIYMEPDRIKCNMCSFKPLCYEQTKGRDVEALIESDYHPRVNNRKETIATDDLDAMFDGMDVLGDIEAMAFV